VKNLAVHLLSEGKTSSHHTTVPDAQPQPQADDDFEFGGGFESDSNASSGGARSDREGENDSDADTTTRSPTRDPAQVVGGVRRSSRRRRLSSRLRDYEIDLPPSLIPADLIGLIEAANGDPRSIKEALESSDASEWSKAMNVEFQQLLKNKTWKLVDRIPGVPVLSNRWVLLK
jgi:hypothetical protein